MNDPQELEKLQRKGTKPTCPPCHTTVLSTSQPERVDDLVDLLRIWPASYDNGNVFSSTYIEKLMRQAASEVERLAATDDNTVLDSYANENQRLSDRILELEAGLAAPAKADHVWVPMEIIERFARHYDLNNSDKRTPSDALEIPIHDLRALVGTRTAVVAPPAPDGTQGALALYLNEVQPVDGRVQINISLDELNVLRHLVATPAVEMINDPALDPCSDLSISELIEWLDNPQWTNGSLSSDAEDHMSSAARLIEKLLGVTATPAVGGEARRQDIIDALMHDERPDGSNADEWRLFLSMYLDNRATRPDGLSFVAVQIAEAIDAASQAAVGGEEMVLHPLSDIRDLDEVVRELGIEDSGATPAEAVRELKAEIEKLHLAAPPASPLRGRAHKVMTPEEYASTPIIGWHEVCEDVDGFGGIGIRYISASLPEQPLRGRESIARIIDPCAFPYGDPSYSTEECMRERIEAFKKADAILALESPAQPDHLVLNETDHDGKIMQTVMLSDASELVREKAVDAKEK